MKALRLLVLLLMAMLLPLRGAMAAVVCPMATSPLPVLMAPAEGDTGCHHEDAAPAPGDGCHLCAALCSATPLPVSLPTLAAPTPVGPTRFAELTVPAPSFLRSGPERPPRSR